MLLMSLGVGGVAVALGLAHLRAAEIRQRIARAGLADALPDGPARP